jgi:hypothetical protein
MTKARPRVGPISLSRAAAPRPSFSTKVIALATARLSPLASRAAISFVSKNCRRDCPWRFPLEINLRLFFAFRAAPHQAVACRRSYRLPTPCRRCPSMQGGIHARGQADASFPVGEARGCRRRQRHRMGTTSPHTAPKTYDAAPSLTVLTPWQKSIGGCARAPPSGDSRTDSSSKDDGRASSTSRSACSPAEAHGDRCPSRGRRSRGPTAPGRTAP